MKNQHGGISILGLFGVLAIAAGVIVSVKVAPSYLHYWYIQSAVERAVSEQVGDLSNEAVFDKIERYLHDNSVYSIDPADVVSVAGRGPGRTFDVDYDITVPLVGNLSIMLAFGEQDAES